MTSIFSRSRSRTNKHTGDVSTRGGFTRNPSTQSVTAHPETSQSAEESHSGKSLRSTFCTRLVKVDDEELASMALDTKLRIDWRSVVLSARVGPARWRRVQILDNFAVYTRQEAQRYGVLAVGTVPGCVAEIVNVLQSQNSTQFAQHMEGIFEHQFREGSIVHHVDVTNETLPDRTCHQDGAELAELSVKTVTFNKSGWLSHHEEWCFLDSIYRHGDTNAGTVEKFLTTMHPKDIIAGLSGAKTKYFHDVVCGYLLRPGADGSSNEDNASTASTTTRMTSVTFYAELETPKQFPFSLSSTRSFSLGAPDKTIKQRLVRLAQSTARLTALVRRQRLGLQVLVDGNRFLPPMNTPCKVCTRALMVAKQCRLCGHAVCGDCSDIHERARQPRRSPMLQVTTIRVCAACLHRVDQAVYENLSSSSLLGSAVVADPPGAKTAAAMLKDLLQDALLSAPSPNRKACVMSVIKCVLNQETEEELAKQTPQHRHKGSFASSGGVSGTSTPVLLTPTSSVYDYVKAMDYLEVDHHVEPRSDELRSYQIDPAGSSAVPHPMPEDEAARLRAVDRVSVSDLQSSTELEILCDVAAKEMGCMTSAISIIDSDTFHVVASNTPEMRQLALPRESALCSHTIMEKSPLIVKHPEADVRFSKFDTVSAFGVRYYCAFPLMGENDQIIGAMCCINSESMEITESQFAAFEKLTSTASKVVRLQTTKRLRKLSSASSTASSDSSGGSSNRGGARDPRVAPSA